MEIKKTIKKEYFDHKLVSLSDWTIKLDYKKVNIYF